MSQQRINGLKQHFDTLTGRRDMLKGAGLALGALGLGSLPGSAGVAAAPLAQDATPTSPPLPPGVSRTSCSSWVMTSAGCSRRSTTVA